MGRKNWPFANTPGGAQASSVIYSLIDTAKENGLDLRHYLLWIQQNAPQRGKTGNTWAEKLLHGNTPEECYEKIIDRNFGAQMRIEIAALYTWLRLTVSPIPRIEAVAKYQLSITSFIVPSSSIATRSVFK